MVDLGITKRSTTMWSRWKTSILLVIMISWIAKATPGTSQNFKITPKPCTVNGIEGTCMFVWECIKSEGQHVGVCVDSFMFGSCCSHNLTDNVIPQNYHQTVTYRPKPAGSNKHKPQKPSQKPTEGTVNKHSTLSTPAQQSDLEMAASSMSTGIFTTHWQATTEPSFITKTRPPKPSKPSKKPILSGSNNIQSTILKPKPSAKPTKSTTTTVKYTTTTSIISTTTRRPTTQEPPTSIMSFSTELVPPSTTTIDTNTSLAAVSLSTVIDGGSFSSSPEMYTMAPGRSTLSAARNYECGVQTMGRPETRIVGGKNAPFGRWPWQVSVRRTSFFGFSSTHRCGGAVVNDNWIVTAGHCVDDLLTSQIRIRVGEYDFSHVQEQLPYTERAVARKVVHPKYNFFTYEFDLALVKLEQALVFAPHISPICLPGTDDLLIGENATVTGWGRLSEGGTLPSVLQEVSVPIVSNDRCKTMFLRAGRHEFIPDIFLCAGHETGGQDSCQGDSGGPLQVKGKDGHYFLAGIISWGIGCAEANLPGVCTRISKFVPWILETVL
ncbi:serine proteinase stubble isoform X3 [Malaya genurostris]|uniref:serine proteinase stubble isoform X3 n=1 Tax=Malaya genurostris TaxID=325434 RepID=UPI0026F3A796|nr:serine proteinase stubble isoform X3 [Malaya genurostris]